jgi:hypothetical protein
LKVPDVSDEHVAFHLQQDTSVESRWQAEIEGGTETSEDGDANASARTSHTVQLNIDRKYAQESRRGTL